MLAISPIAAQSQESAGTLSITEAMVRPTYFSKEKEGGEFLLGDSQFGIGWDLNEKLRTRFLLGSLTQRQAPIFYQSTEASDELGFIEAYGEFEGLYGKLRMGLMPIPLGYENRVPDRNLIFPVSQLFSSRLLARRDYGLSFYTENNGYFTEIMAHNGEVDEPNKDGNIWASSRWGWTDTRRWHVEFAMQVGRTEAESTSANGSNIADFDVNRTATWKFSLLSLNYFKRKWNVVLEGLYGDIEQDNFKNRVYSYHMDVTYMWTSSFGLAARYDQLDLNDRVEGDAQDISSLSFIFGAENETSRFFVTLSKKNEQGLEIPNDELRLSWRIRPYF